VAFVSCDPSAPAPSLVLWSAGASAPLATKAQWTEGASDTVKSVAVSPSGTVAAFTVGPPAGRPPPFGWPIPMPRRSR
jgi:hypothetical protein